MIFSNKNVFIVSGKEKNPDLSLDLGFGEL